MGTTVYISEYSETAGRAQIGMEPALFEYTLSFSTVASISTHAFDPATNLVRIHPDGICSIAIVASTTASGAATTNKRLPADATEYFGVKLGYHVSAISNS